ncbi:MFS transporter [Paenibacillus validus]|nr:MULTISPECIES: MFS transporter [Paenibacillus]MED4600266.1 MFS transporter [Paenibacillus validus]MED4605267.1 MFS transporter [Paenibacillus validus]
MSKPSETEMRHKQGQISPQSQMLLITAIGFGVLLNPLNTTMISVAFSRLQQEFQVPYSAISWLIATYYVASAVAQPVMGKLSDMLGRKRIFLLGLLLVTISSMLAPFSPSIGWLMAFRVIQAIGTSSLFPAGMGMIRSSITDNQARALSVMSIFSSTSAAFGPSIGGFLIQYGDWPAIFFVNFPVILISFFMSIKILPKDGPRKPIASGGLDLWGIVFFTALIVSWLFFFLSFEQGFNVWLLIVSLVMSFLFYQFEKRRKQPFIDVFFLKNNLNVCMVYIQFICVNIVFYSVMFSIPSYLQQVRHFDAQRVGLIMLAVSGFSVFVTPWVGRWIDKSGSKSPLIAGSLFVMAGSLLLLLLHDNTLPYVIFAFLSVFGISNGFQNLGLQTALYSYVSTKETGIASGLFMTSRFMGTILSSSLLGAIFSSEFSTQRLHTMAAVCAVISVAILVLSLKMPSHRPQTPYAE